MSDSNAVGIEFGQKPAASSCGCGGTDVVEFPELDTRLIAHEIRHATIFGALSGVRPGRGLIITASHDPIPLLAQLEQREPGAFEQEYLEKGPEVWKIRFERKV